MIALSGTNRIVLVVVSIAIVTRGRTIVARRVARRIPLAIIAIVIVQVCSVSQSLSRQHWRQRRRRRWPHCERLKQRNDDTAAAISGREGSGLVTALCC